MQFEKLLRSVNFPSRESVSLLGEEALKPQTDVERLEIITVLFKSNSQILISLYVCYYLLKSSQSYRILLQSLICKYFPKLYEAANSATKTKIRNLHVTWRNVLSEDILNKIKSSMDSIDTLCDSDASISGISQCAEEEDSDEESDTESDLESDGDSTERVSLPTYI